MFVVWHEVLRVGTGEDSESAALGRSSQDKDAPRLRGVISSELPIAEETSSDDGERGNSSSSSKGGKIIAGILELSGSSGK